MLRSYVALSSSSSRWDVDRHSRTSVKATTRGGEPLLGWPFDVEVKLGQVVPPEQLVGDGAEGTGAGDIVVMRK